MGGDSRGIWFRLGARLLGRGTFNPVLEGRAGEEPSEEQGGIQMKRMLGRASSVCEGTSLVCLGTWAEAVVTME